MSSPLSTICYYPCQSGHHSTAQHHEREKACMLCACNIKYRQSGNSEGLGRTCSYARSFELPKRPFYPIPICVMSKNRLWEQCPKL